MGGHPTLQVSMDKKPAEVGATASATGKEAPDTGFLADQTTDAVITSSLEVSGEYQVRGWTWSLQHSMVLPTGEDTPYKEKQRTVTLIHPQST